MNFFEQQAAARRSSMRLIALFALAILGIVAAVNAVALVLLGAGHAGGVIAVCTVLTLAVIGFGSLYRIASLRGGGAVLAAQFGGVAVPENTVDPQLRRLRNVVEEIAIASGVAVPKLFVLEEEAAINAFAAGYSPSDAAIAVTRGALERLNRDELQGVIAHEFSHILNGDMRLGIRLMGVLFGILMLGLIGRKVLQHGSGGRGRGVGPLLLAALAAMAIGYIGLFFGRMIKAGVSRSRESLADASAVQFTRQTAGLAGALKKIAGLHEGSKLSDRGNAEEVSHMLFGDGVGFGGHAFSKLFATHPPILQRIRALEPGFRSEHLAALQARWTAQPPHGLEEDVRLGLVGAQAAIPPPLPPADARLDVTPPMVVAQVAQPQADDYRLADAIVSALPAALHALARQRASAMPLLLALLLDEDAAIAGKQFGEIASRMGAEAAEAARALRREHVAGLHPAQRLPLASLTFPLLRQRPRPELDAFLDTVHAAVNTDGEVSLFEYCLGRLLQVQVREALDPARYVRFGRRKPGGVKQEFAALLAVVARAGNADAAAAQRAYLAGMQRVLPRDHVPYAPSAEGVRALDPVWEALDALDPLAKQAMVESVTATIGHDGRVCVAEAELLRTICAVLHCPLPPMLGEPVRA
ncbi:M48 family metallopeptidase [Luteimonas aquatica]|uniref:M48 family metallopeptidase n=1 Tax=Luteimonas aquatica TaxID=450364 RepID=UPI001F5AE343|nr:M48 family metallopeptidase [Luteimonas aquatica]